MNSIWESESLKFNFISTIITHHAKWGSTDIIYSYEGEKAYREVIKRDLNGIVTKYGFKWLGKKK